MCSYFNNTVYKINSKVKGSCFYQYQFPEETDRLPSLEALGGVAEDTM